MSNFLEGVADRLVSELKRLGPAALAKETGIARATLYNWMERGNTPMDKLAILESAGVDVQYVLTGQRSSATAPAAAPLITEGERALLKLYNAAPAQVQEGVRTTLGAFQPSADPARQKVKRQRAA